VRSLTAVKRLTKDLKKNYSEKGKSVPPVSLLKTYGTISVFTRWWVTVISVVDPDPHPFENLDPNPHPHQGDKPDPDLFGT
jgi:hypothetical protein